MKLLQTEQKNKVLQSMMNILDKRREDIIAANQKDLNAFNKEDQAMYDRLIVNDAKVDGMITAVKEVMEQDDPVGKVISERKLDNGLHIINKNCTLRYDYDHL